jgi:hypothetical protein
MAIVSDGSPGHATAAKSRPAVVVRPRQRRWNSPGQTAGAAGWMLASLLYSLRFHGSFRIAVVGVGVALAVGVVGLLSLSRRRTKLTMIGGQLIFSGLFRDRVLLAGGSPGRVVDVQVNWGKASGRRSRLWLLINAAGRTAVGLNRETWDDGQLEGLRESLGLPIEIVETPKRPAELRKAYPGTLPWWVAHPSVATLIGIVTLTALVLAFQRLAS